MTKHTVDMENRVEQLEEKTDEKAERVEEIKSEAQDLAGSEDEEEQVRFEQLEDEFEDVATELELFKRELNVFEETIKGWDGTVFEVEELTFGEVQEVKDETIDESFDVDVQREDVSGTPKEGFYQLLFLEKSLVSWPEGAPSKKERVNGRRQEVAHPGNYPDKVGEWLFGVVDNINTFGDTELGNTSLRDEIDLED